MHFLALTFSIFTAYNITERHMFLETTIGYLEKEHESFLRVQIILFGSLAYMIVGSILEGLLFILYNKKFHPFTKILDPDEEIELQTVLDKPDNTSQQITTSNSCCYDWISLWEKWNSFKNVVHMTSDKSKPEKSCSWKNCRDFYVRNSGKWNKFCIISFGIISVTFSIALIASIIIFGSGLPIPSSKFQSGSSYI